MISAKFTCEAPLSRPGERSQVRLKWPPRTCRRACVRQIARAFVSAALAVLLTAGLLVVGSVAAGASSPPDEAAFVAKINALRTSKGLAALTPDAALAATACTWN